MLLGISAIQSRCKFAHDRLHPVVVQAQALSVSPGQFGFSLVVIFAGYLELIVLNQEGARERERERETERTTISM